MSLESIDMTERIDLGFGIEAQWITCSHGPERCGLLIRHVHNGRPRVSAGIKFAVPCRAGNVEPWWTLEQREPLTISPSIRCDCGLHGFIRDGKWVPA